MAYTVKIPDRKCSECMSKATHEVFNHVNASCGDFCKKHALAYVVDLKKRGA